MAAACFRPHRVRSSAAAGPSSAAGRALMMFFNYWARPPAGGGGRVRWGGGRRRSLGGWCRRRHYCYWVRARVWGAAARRHRLFCGGLAARGGRLGRVGSAADDSAADSDGGACRASAGGCIRAFRRAPSHSSGGGCRRLDAAAAPSLPLRCRSATTPQGSEGGSGNF